LNHARDFADQTGMFLFGLARLLTGHREGERNRRAPGWDHMMFSLMTPTCCRLD
jgi:hypothetical protein